MTARYITLFHRKCTKPSVGVFQLTVLCYRSAYTVKAHSDHQRCYLSHFLWEVKETFPQSPPHCNSSWTSWKQQVAVRSRSMLEMGTDRRISFIKVPTYPLPYLSLGKENQNAKLLWLWQKCQNATIGTHSGGLPTLLYPNFRKVRKPR